MVAKLFSMGLLGVEVFPVTIETDLSRGLPAFDLVGLPGTAVRESRDRVRAAIINNGFSFPTSRITVNLAPANQRKEGPLYDLPLLLSLLLSSEQIAFDPTEYIFLGELSLSGELRPVKGVLPMLLKAAECGFSKAIIPAENRAEGAVIRNMQVFGANTLEEILAHLTGRNLLAPVEQQTPAAISALPVPDFSDVKGQSGVKRALEIAAAGGHNLLLIGPPGSGKSMLAKRIPSILPKMTWEETIDTTKLYSVSGNLTPEQPLITQRPFRSPHHTVSAAGLIGGGSVPQPGEVSLAHNGVLFLDELPEFPRQVTDVLRQPMEDFRVTISRATTSVSYPSSFMLVAAMNPCPCGYFGHPVRPCTCSAATVSRYLSRVSGPLLDRFDLHVEVPPVEFSSLVSTQQEESSAAIRARVDAARAVQEKRFGDTGIHCNARMTSSKLQEWCKATPAAQKLLERSFEKLGLSARAYDRVLKVSRTIADLAGSEEILPAHAAEAIQYRNLDRKYWQKELV